MNPNGPASFTHGRIPMKKTSLLALASVLAGLLILTDGSPAEAQYYGYRPAPPPPPPGFIPRMNPFGYKHRPHFYLQGQLSGLAVFWEQLDGIGSLGHGGGFGLGGGVRFGRFVALETNWVFTAHDAGWANPDNPNDPRAETITYDSQQLQTLTLDLKLFIPTWGRAEPFFQVGGGWAFFGYTGYNGPEQYSQPYLYTSGPTFNAGAGGEIWFGPHFSMGGRILYKGVYFGESNYGIPYKDKATATWKDGTETHSNFVSGVGVDLFATFHF